MLANATRRIGTFDQRVTILQPEASLDGAGQEIATYEPVATVWAKEVPQRGDEPFVSQQYLGQSAVLLEFREYRSDITVKYRLRFRGIDWNIANIRPIGRNEGLEVEVNNRGNE